MKRYFEDYKAACKELKLLQINVERDHLTSILNRIPEIDRLSKDVKNLHEVLLKKNIDQGHKATIAKDLDVLSAKLGNHADYFRIIQEVNPNNLDGTRGYVDMLKGILAKYIEALDIHQGIIEQYALSSNDGGVDDIELSNKQAAERTGFTPGRISQLLGKGKINRLGNGISQISLDRYMMDRNAKFGE